jgi:uncharacterized protein involved in exopolysaccharide biosynthesis
MSDVEAVRETPDVPRLASAAAGHPPRAAGTRRSLAGLLLLSRRRFIIAGSLAMAVILVAVGMIRRPTYTSEATFVPQSRRTQSGAGALAAQLGISLPGADVSGTPAYYADLIESRTVLAPLISGSYLPPNAPAGTRPVTLAEEFRINTENPRTRAELTERALRRAIAPNVSPRTGVVTVAVRASAPWLAKVVADSLLASLNRFNIMSRRAQARDEFQFTEARLQEVRAELRTAEAREEMFLQRNRDYRNSPQLNFEHERLAREVAFRQQVVTSLAQSAEQMKVEQVRDTPVLTILDRPEMPATRDGRGSLSKAIIGLVVGALLAAIFVLVRGFTAQLAGRADAMLARIHPDELRRALLDLMHPWRLLMPAQEKWYR